VIADAVQPIELLERTNSYLEYQRGEGIPRLAGFAVDDLHTVELAPWARRGGRGAFVNLDGAGGTNDAYVCEIPPGGALVPQRQLYEEMIYVLDGNGSTQVWYGDAHKVSFEWQAGSLFAVPLNAKHQHFNGRGVQPARFLAVTSAPLVINLFHNLRFVFDSPFVFDDRFDGQRDYFAGAGKLYRTRRDRRVLDTNFVPDVRTIELYASAARGAGGRNVTFELAHNTMAAHVSEFPVGTYKKAHRHGPGAHVIILSGHGHSLLWPHGTEPTRVDWRAGSMVVPPENWFHQHVNDGATPARYLALRWGSWRYDAGGALPTGEDKVNVDQKAGGAQIEYADENPQIHAAFEADLACSGATCRMRSMVPWCSGE
jgi:oxalate decarboxylase/phosphoglucose isomerase-like protein (cupin superfamily)